MSAGAVIFYILSTCILGAAVLAVTTKKIFRAAIWLLFSLMSVAGLYFWMELPFIAAVQIIVYAGGIVVLIIFSIFLTQQSGKKMPAPLRSRSLFSILSVLFGFALTGSLLYQYGFEGEGNGSFDVEVADIGTQLLSTTAYGYVLPFEVISMLLLAAMVGCIVIAMKTQEPPLGNTEMHSKTTRL